MFVVPSKRFTVIKNPNNDNESSLVDERNNQKEEKNTSLSAVIATRTSFLPSFVVDEEEDENDSDFMVLDTDDYNESFDNRNQHDIQQSIFSSVRNGLSDSMIASGLSSELSSIDNSNSDVNTGCSKVDAKNCDNTVPATSYDSSIASVVSSNLSSNSSTTIGNSSLYCSSCLERLERKRAAQVVLDLANLLSSSSTINTVADNTLNDDCLLLNCSCKPSQRSQCTINETDGACKLRSKLVSSMQRNGPAQRSCQQLSFAFENDSGNSTTKDFTLKSPRSQLRSPLLSSPHIKVVLPRKSSMKSLNSPSNSTNRYNSSSSTNSLSRTVSFGSLQTREYSVALSDHPSCSFGPPVQLGWEYSDRDAVPVHEYELQRSPHRRTLQDLLLSYNKRKYLLLKRAGYSKAEIKAAMKEVERVKRQRMITDILLPIENLVHSIREALQL